MSSPMFSDDSSFINALEELFLQGNVISVKSITNTFNFLPPPTSCGRSRPRSSWLLWRGALVTPPQSRDRWKSVANWVGLFTPLLLINHTAPPSGALTTSSVMLPVGRSAQQSRVSNCDRNFAKPILNHS